MTITELENVEDVYPLSSLQEGMLFHTVAEPGSGVFINQISVRFEGDLDPATFKAAWAELLSRHAILRTAFVWDGIDDPLQVVREQASLGWTEEDWTSLNSDEHDHRIDELLAADRRRGFDLAKAPLTRMMLVRTGPASWRWVWSTHHLIVDGWSARVLLDELHALYAGGTAGEHVELDPPFRFRDFIAHHASRLKTDEEAFWRNQLGDFVEPHHLDVPGIVPDPNAGGHRSHTVMLDPARSAALQAMARDQNVTLNSAVIGAWSLLLSRWTRDQDVVFGVTSSGRDATLRGIEGGVGLFINTLPFRLEVPPGRPLAQWLRDLQGQQLEARSYEQSSLAAVQGWSGVPAGKPLFESIFVFENYPPSARQTRPTGLAMSDVKYVEQSNYPLAVLVVPGEALEVTFVYDCAQLAPKAIEQLGSQLMTLLDQFGAFPANRLAEFSLTSTEDRTELAPRTTGPRMMEDERCVHEIIESITAAQPEAAAVTFQDRSLTYRELDDQAGRLAAHLQMAGVGPNRPVGLYLPRSIDMIVGILGILKAGGGYVPLDPTYPIDHIRQLLDNDSIDIVLTNNQLRPVVPATRIVVSIDDAGALPASWKPPTVRDTDLAYVIHTSGSTGRPKGVMVTHRNLVHSTRARTVHYSKPVGRFLLLSSLSFDSSVAGVFWTLCTGGTLVLPPPRAEQDIDHLLTLASEQEITHLLCLPALYQLLAEHDTADQLASLEVAIVAGEACPSTVLDLHLERVPQAELHNEYGPTEATVWCSVHRATAADVGDPLPIGRPIAGTRLYLLDDYGRQVPPGFAGELCVAGPGVSGGYLGRADLTAERFVTVDIDGTPERIYRTGDLACYRSDGALLFQGRTDAQLKVRGHRIEPGAVEGTLLSHPAVIDATVLSRSPDDQAAGQLIGYAVFDSDPLEPATLKKYLRDRLPEFMVPDVVIPLEMVPRLPNGKVDTGSLPHLSGSREGSSKPASPPQSDVEVTLAHMWTDILGVDIGVIGADSDFFDLGGHSLLAIRLMSAVHTTFGASLSLSALFDAPRLSEFARLVENCRPPSQSSVMVPIRESGDPTLFLIHPGGGNVLVYEPLARHLPHHVTVIGIQARGVEGTEDPDRTFEAMAVRYAEEIAARAQPGPISLAGYSTGGLIAFEVARILERDRQDVGLVALLDTVYPAGRGIRARLAREFEVVRTGGWPGVRTVADWWWGSIRGLAGRIRHAPRWAYLLSRHRSLPPGLAGKRINQIALKAQRLYEPGPYAGTITYIRALGDGTRFHDSLPRWQAVTGEVVVRDAPGLHAGEGNMVSEPHAAALAAILTEQLGSAEVRGL